MTTTILRGGAVVANPDEPGGAVVEDGAVAVQNGRIEALGTFAEISAAHPGADVIGSDSHVIIPGLVNTHHHGWGLTTFQLGAKDDLLEPWIVDLLQALRPIDPYLDTLWSDMQNIRHGVTTLLHASLGRHLDAYEWEVREKLRAHADSGIRASVALHVNDQNTFVYQDNDTFLASVPDELANRIRTLFDEVKPLTPDGVFELLERLVTEYESHSRISVMLCPIAPQWCSDDLLRRVRQKADELDVLIHLHCLESPYQREYARRTYGRRMITHLNELGFLDRRVSFGHAVWVSDEEIAICADTGASICHNASSNLRLRVGILPLAALLDRDVNVSLGIDGTGINDDEDMIQELRLVAKLGRLPRGFPLEPPPSSLDVLRLATRNGARTLNLEGSLGTLGPGSIADVVLVDTARLREPYLAPGTDILDALLYRATGADVDTVMIDGEVVLRGGRFTCLDRDEIARRLAAAVAVAPPELHVRWAGILEDLRPHIARFWEDWSPPATNPYYLVNSKT
jgi:cytosine/adenosine deaminase-related metal-dependent hydrolase